jgi:hypothetical protein
MLLPNTVSANDSNIGFIKLQWNYFILLLFLFEHSPVCKEASSTLLQPTTRRFFVASRNLNRNISSLLRDQEIWQNEIGSGMKETKNIPVNLPESTGSAYSEC